MSATATGLQTACPSATKGTLRTGVWLPAADGGLVEMPSWDALPTVTPPWRRVARAVRRIVSSLLSRVLRTTHVTGAP